MKPFHFGTKDRRLFAVYEDAQDRGGPARAAVLCSPLGDEQVFAHRTLRQLSARLSRAGFHVLRFDYWGTGDASGEAEKIDVAGWCDDVETAVQEIAGMTGAAGVTLAGLRLGANLAARAAARSRAIDQLVLWEPFLAGDLAPACDRIVAELAQPSLPVSPASREDLAQLQIEPQIDRLPRQTLLVLMGEAAHARGLETLEVAHTADAIPWIEERTVTGTVPAEALRRIVSWVV